MALILHNGCMSHRYLLFWKPFDVLCQFSPGDQPEQRTLAEFIDVPGVYPAGRLDRDSEGLLLLTDHGALQHRLCDPRFGHPRTYWVQVEHIPADAALEALRRGIDIKDYRTRPARVTRLDPAPDLPPRQPPIRVRKTIPDAWLEITLTEGKNRQVRRMTAAVGHPTLRLVRSRIGLPAGFGIDHLDLGGLQPGEWRDLTTVERQALLSLLQNRSSHEHPMAQPQKRRFR